MPIFDLSQQKDGVEHLGKDVFHDTEGHNELTAQIEGTDLSHAYLEFSLNGRGFEAMREFTAADFQMPLEEQYHGILFEGFSVRESLDIQWTSDSQDRLIMVWGDNNGGEDLYWAESPTGDPTAFENAQIVLTTSEKTEDPNFFYDRPADTLYVYYEDNSGHGEVGIHEATTREATDFGNKTVIGGSKWGLSHQPASPVVWKHNGDYFLSGEDHNTSNYDLMIAKGDSPTNFTDSVISAQSADYSNVDIHINFQGQCHIDKNGKLHAYTNVKDGTDYHSRYFSTETFDSQGFPVEPWTMSDHTGKMLSCIFPMFNDFYVYGNDLDQSIIYWWNLNGQVVEKPLDSTGGEATFEYYEPTVPPGSTIEWRVVAEDTSGNIETSETQSFTIADPYSTLPMEDEYSEYGRLRTGRKNTTERTIELSTESDWTDSEVLENVDITDGAVVISQTSPTVIESFEDGDISEYGGDTGAYSVTQTDPYHGDYRLESDGSSVAIISNTDVGLSEPYTLRTWFNVTSGSNVGFLFNTQNKNGVEGISGYQTRFRFDSNIFDIVVWTDGSSSRIADTSVSSTGDGWYYVEVSNDGSTITSTLYDSSDTQIGEISVSDSTYSGGGIGFYSATANSIDYMTDQS